MSNPEPKKVIEGDFQGLWYIVPVELGGDNGENWIIVDTYAITLPTIARFVSRTKQYSEPHKTKEEFSRCGICKENNRKYGKTREDEILI